MIYRLFDFHIPKQSQRARWAVLAVALTLGLQGLGAQPATLTISNVAISGFGGNPACPTARPLPPSTSPSSPPFAKPT